MLRRADYREVTRVGEVGELFFKNRSGRNLGEERSSPKEREMIIA